MKRFFPIILLFCIPCFYAKADIPVGYDTITVCNRDLPFIWHGQELSMMGDYQDTISTENGDSLCLLNLKIQYRSIQTTEVELAEGESYLWRNNLYSQPGYYLDTVDWAGECGVIYQLVVKSKTTPEELVSCLSNLPDSALFDYSLQSGNVQCYNGTRANPYASFGSGVFFPANSTEVDPLTKMSVVPTFGVPSLRIGVYAIGHGSGFATDIKYTPNEDASAMRIMFANVMQTAPSWHSGGAHQKSVLPVFFSICIVDSNGDTIPGSYFTKEETAENYWTAWTGLFVKANETLPWYHPWDSYIVDVSNYVGQQLTIKAITTECSTHSCSSELYLAFVPAEIKATCCDVCGVILSAPKGKRYVWHKGSPDGEIVSTMDALCTEADGTMYYCDIFDDLLGTSVTLSHKAYAELPIADFKYDIDLCTSTVTFYDSSFVSYNGSTPINPHKYPAHCYWDFGNGNTYEGHTPPSQIYTPNADYEVVLIAENDNACNDTLRLNLHIPEQPPHYEYTRVDTICATDVIQIGDSAYSKIGEYTDTLQTAIYGCDSIIHTVIRHWPTYNPSLLSDIGAEHLEPQEPTTPPGVIRPGEQWKDPLAPEYIKYDTICQGEQYEWRGHIYTMGGTYGDTLSTIHGCDSIFLLHLYAYPHYIHTPLGPITAEHLTPTQQTTPIGVVRPGEQWKDPLAPDYMYHDTICKGDTLLWHGKKLTEEKIYTDTLKTIHGCDSIFYMDLHWKYCGCDTTYSVSYKQIREEELPYIWNTNTVTAVPANEGRDTTLIFTTTNAAACDSIATLHLHILDACEPAAIYLPEEWGNNVK